MRTQLAEGGFQVPGDPAELRWLAARLASQADALLAIAMEIGDVQAERWTGPAGQAFKTVVRAQPGRYQSAGEAFVGAAGAVRVFADALEDAQHVVVAAAQLGGGDLGVSLVSAARDDLGTAAQRTAAVLFDLARGAPRSERFLGRLTADGFDAVALPAHVAKGIAVGAASMVDGLSRLGTVQALESPAVALVDRGVRKRVGSQIDVAREAVHDPAGFMESAGKSLLAWDEWSKDPAQALGQVLMMAAGTAFTDGAGDAADGAAAAADVADAARSADIEKSFRPTDGAPPSGPGISLDQARVAAERNGLDLSNVDLMYEAPGTPGYRPTAFGHSAFNWDNTPFRNAAGKFEITLQDRGLASEREAVSTIAHEWAHLYLVGSADHAGAEEYAQQLMQGYRP